MILTERKNNRGKIQIMGDVLALATSGIRKTHVMYKANLSYEQAHAYLSELMAKGLVMQDVSEDGTVYRATERGREFLSYYLRIAEFLEGPSPAPLLSSRQAAGSRAGRRQPSLLAGVKEYDSHNDDDNNSYQYVIRATGP